jgi:hypothetical protein
MRAPWVEPLRGPNGLDLNKISSFSILKQAEVLLFIKNFINYLL